MMYFSETWHNNDDWQRLSESLYIEVWFEVHYGYGLYPVFGCKIFVDVVVAPPAVYLEYTKNSIQDKIKVSAQNCYKENKGAFTGETRWALACTPLAYPTTTNSHHG